MDSLVPQMHAEAGYEVDESVPPLRISGFLCLLFGVLSFFGCMGRPMLVFPLIAFFFGFIALRKSSGPTPVGTRPAMIGLVLAVGFGVCGFMMPWFKTATLARQAETFGRYYMDVIALGEDEFAVELGKNYLGRFPQTMSLKEHYAGNEPSQHLLEEFKQNSIHDMLRSRGPGAEWEIDRPIRVYYSYNSEHAEIIWMDPTGEVDSKILMILDYTVDKEGNGQWNVSTMQPFHKRFVAESVL